MKRKTLREIRHQLPHKFIVTKRIFQERESEEEEEEEEEEKKEESPSSLGDNKYSFLYTPSSFPRFDITTPKMLDSSAFGNPVPRGPLTHPHIRIVL